MNYTQRRATPQQGGAVNGELDVPPSPLRIGRSITGDEAAIMFNAAVKYHNCGFAVIPQIPGDKKPAVTWREYQDQLPTPACVDTWWREHFSGAGIAVVLGRHSDLFAIDVDGPEAHAALVDRLGCVPHAPTAVSGSGKPFRYHLFFRYPRELETKSKSTPWHPKLEFRGSRGVIVLPPSLHPSGNRYAWADGKSLDDIALPEVPNKVAEALAKTAAQKRPPLSCEVATPHTGRSPIVVAPRGVSYATEQFLDGHFANGPNWNDRLFNAACDLAGSGVGLETATRLLLAGARPWNADEEAKAIGTIESAYNQSRRPAREFAGESRSRSGTGRRLRVGNIDVILQF